MRAILVVLSALTATAVVHTRDCRACIFVTAVVKKVMTQGREITNENVVGLTCPRLLRDNPPSVGKLCKNIVKEILDSRILMRKIKRKKGLGDWTSFFCSRELSRKYCPNGYYNPKLFRELSKV